MKKSTYIQDILQAEANLQQSKLAEIANNIANFYGLKCSTENNSVLEVAFESNFKKTPTNSVIKMAKSNHVDDFFKDGTIQLGSFEYYQQFENSEVEDKAEGYLIVIARNSKSTNFIVGASGYNQYMFCAYDGDPDPSLIDRFGYDDYYEIIDIQGFQNEIAKTLNSIEFSRGKCQYAKIKAIVTDIDENFDFTRISSDTMNLVGNSKYFLKTSDYQHQNEFRFLWSSPSDLKDKIIIKCPEAVKYCKRK